MTDFEKPIDTPEWVTYPAAEADALEAVVEALKVDINRPYHMTPAESWRGVILALAILDALR